MIVIKPQQEKCDYTYNILFPDTGSIAFFESYDELITSLFYNNENGNDIVDIQLPIRDINYVRKNIFNLFKYIFIFLLINKIEMLKVN